MSLSLAAAYLFILLAVATPIITTVASTDAFCSSNSNCSWISNVTFYGYDIVKLG